MLPFLSPCHQSLAMLTQIKALALLLGALSLTAAQEVNGGGGDEKEIDIEQYVRKTFPIHALIRIL